MAGKGLFSEASLRFQWRVAQFAVGLPVAVLVVVWVGRLLFVPDAAVAEARWFISDPWRLLPTIAAAMFVLWVDRYLEKAKAAPKAPTSGDTPPAN